MLKKLKKRRAVKRLKAAQIQYVKDIQSSSFLMPDSIWETFTREYNKPENRELTEYREPAKYQHKET